MSINRLVITAVVIENRPVRDVAVEYGVSKSWIYLLLERYRREGEAVFAPRSRRPKTAPTAIPAEVVELIVELRAEADRHRTRCRPRHHRLAPGPPPRDHRLPGHHLPLSDQGRAGRPGAEEETEVVLHPVRSGDAERVLAVRLHPLSTSSA
jgi:hypothetical protein